MFYVPLAPSQLPPLFAGLRIVEAIVLGQELTPTNDWKVQSCVEKENDMITLVHPDEHLQRVLKKTVAEMSLGVTILRCADHGGSVSGGR